MRMLIVCNHISAVFIQRIRQHLCAGIHPLTPARGRLKTHAQARRRDAQLPDIIAIAQYHQIARLAIIGQHIHPRRREAVCIICKKRFRPIHRQIIARERAAARRAESLKLAQIHSIVGIVAFRAHIKLALMFHHIALQVRAVRFPQPEKLILAKQHQHIFMQRVHTHHRIFELAVIALQQSQVIAQAIGRHTDIAQFAIKCAGINQVAPRFIRAHIPRKTRLRRVFVRLSHKKYPHRFDEGIVAFF